MADVAPVIETRIETDKHLVEIDVDNNDVFPVSFDKNVYLIFSVIMSSSNCR